MTKQVINVGSAANDGSGTPARTAFQYVNANFTELYDFLTGTPNGTTIPTALPIAKGGTGATSAATARTNLGLGTAAAANIGNAAGNVMEVGSFGLGGRSVNSTNTDKIDVNGFYHEQLPASASPSSMNYAAFIHVRHMSANGYAFQFGAPMGASNLSALKGRICNAGVWSNVAVIYNTHNTTKDSNGFIKAASPVVKLFSDHIELNTDAEKQPIQFEKVEEGDYLLKGSLGFAQEGWYIEVPKDANGNTVVAVEYSTLENGDLSIKTYKRKFDVEKAAIVADLENPLDIPEGRWIDIRLHEELVVEETLPDDTE